MNEDKNKKSSKVKENLVHKGGQAAATYFGGAAGKKIYDKASETELGQKIEKAVSNKITNPLNNSKNNHVQPDISTDKNNSLEENSSKDDSYSNKDFTRKNLKKNSSKSNNKSLKEDEEVNHSGENFVQKFNKLPAPVKAIIFSSSGYVLIFIAIILFILFVTVRTTDISESLFINLINNNQTSDEFYNDENYFSSVKDSKVEKAEKAYYKKLEEVYNEFKSKYGVEIDTTLITATLFYGKTIEDYGEEDKIEDVENNSDFSDPAVNEDQMYESDMVEFYKLAKRHIKTLAKYMLIQTTVFNACVDTEEEEKYVITPYSAKDVANNWTTISTWKFGTQKAYNSINIFNYVVKEKKTYTKADGTENTIDFCKYKDLDTQLNSFYEEDKKIYKDRKEKYDSCVTKARTACKAKCPSCDSTNDKVDCSSRDECRGLCDADNYDSVCKTEKEAYQKAEKIYRENWTDEKLYDDDGYHSCVNTTLWGEAQSYADEEKYMNYPFQLELVEKATIRNFLHDYEYMIDRTKKIKCSNEPSISYRYETDNSEEGVYYYKLMENTPAGILDFIKNDSFIQRYYPELIDNTSEETIEKSEKHIVDEIFLLYSTVIEREYKYCYTPGGNNTSGSNSVNTSVNYGNLTDFIQSIYSSAIKDMENSGILASVTMAQAILESGSGKSTLARTYNNYYGMTAGSCAPAGLSTTGSKLIKAGEGGNKCTGNAYWNGDIVWMCNSKGADCQWYRVYDSFANSTHDHSRLLTTSRYNCQGILDPSQAISCIKNGGYATDPDYVSKVMNVINTHGLTQFDIGEWNGEIITDYSGNGLGTICFQSSMDRDLALGKEIANGEGTINGFVGNMRTQLYGTPEYRTYWGSNNNIFHASGYDKECTWYANGRGMELLVNNGMSLAQAKQYMRPMSGNAGRWFHQNKYFSSSTNVYQPKEGAIIVWSNGSKPGHVAIVERVHYDGSGKAVSVDISHGGQSINGFQFTTNKSIENWVSKHGTYRFIGYVYLLG